MPALVPSSSSPAGGLLACGLAVAGMVAATVPPGAASPPLDHVATSTVDPQAAPSTAPSVPQATRGTTVRRPNVLLITVDDMAVGDERYMPHLNRLVASQGTTFTQAIAPTPICVPARASLLTGQYTHNHRAYTIEGRGGGYAAFDARRTLPVALRASGYDTLFVGKYLNGYGDSPASRRRVPPGWSSWQATVGESTYSYLRPVLNDNGRLRPQRVYSTSLFGRLTQQRLSEPARKRKPWYLWVNYVAPHHGGPLEASDPRARFPGRPDLWVQTPRPAAQDKGRFAGLRLPRTPDMFHHVTGDPTSGGAMSPRRRQMVRYAHQQRIESLQSVDRAVRDTVRTLKRTGQWRNTVVMFSSDNGYLVGQANRFGKLLAFDDSLRVPLVVAGPGVPRARRIATAVTNPDIAMTIADYARARIGRRTDGTSFRPLLAAAAAGDTRTRYRPVPLEAYPVAGGTRPVYTGVREGRYTYVRHHRRGNAEVLFDRDRDPYELRNLAGDPRYARVLTHYRGLTKRLVRCRGGTCDRTYSTTITAPPAD